MSVAGQGNVNEKIKELHKQGKSVLEISKQLNIGQGEVKLVLALYGGITNEDEVFPPWTWRGCFTCNTVIVY